MSSVIGQRGQTSKDSNINESYVFVKGYYINDLYSVYIYGFLPKDI